VILGSVNMIPRERIGLSNRRAHGQRALLLLRQDPTESGEMKISGLNVSVDWITAEVHKLEQIRPAGDGLPVSQEGDWLLEVSVVGEPDPANTRPELRFKTGLQRVPEMRVPIQVDYVAPVRVSRREVQFTAGSGGPQTETVLVTVRRGLDPAELRIGAKPDALEARLESSGARHFKLHLTWDGQPLPSAAVSLELGQDKFSLPVRVAER